MTTPTEAAEIWYRRVWAEEDESAIDDLLHPEAAVSGLGEPMDREGFKVFHRGMLSVLGKVHVTIDRAIEDGPWVALRLTVNAVHRETGTAVNTDGQVMARVEDGMIHEAHNNFDFIKMMADLGAMPADALDRAMRGEPIT